MCLAVDTQDMAQEGPNNLSQRSQQILYLIGGSIALLTIGLSLLSYFFPYSPQINTHALWAVITISAISALCLTAVIPHLKKLESSKERLLFVFATGLLMRAVLLFSQPILEDDWYRYLWDGAVVNSGHSPYQFAPADFSPNLFDDSEQSSQKTLPLELVELSKANKVHFERINYPYVNTIYPPIAQLGFSLSNAIAPFNFSAWRVLLLAIDIASFFLLIKALQSYSRSPLWAILYWWNPVLLLQGFGAGHMDLLLVPFLISAIWMAKLSKPFTTSALLAGAVGVKIWPILLAPLFMICAGNKLKAYAKFILSFCILAGVILLPQLYHAISPEAGLTTYSETWRTHAFIFGLFEDYALSIFDNSGQTSRIFVAICISTIALSLAYWSRKDVDRLPHAAALTVLALILMSPTGYPWYLIWIAVLIPFYPNLGVMSLFITAPLYYFRFVLDEQDLIYQWIVLPAAFGVPLVIFISSLLRKKRGIT